jgi:hypothetical protein
MCVLKLGSIANSKGNLEKRNGKMLKRALSLGTVTGVLFGIFFKVIEYFTNIKVYTLLLNIDFIPIVGLIQWPEIIEFLFHLTISWGVAFVFIYFVDKRNLKTKKQMFLIAISLSIPSALLYFPLTILALKPTPAILNVRAIFWWVTGHVFYAALLTFFYKHKQGTNSN